MNRFRAIPFPSSGAHAWREVDGQVTPDTPPEEPPAQPAAPVAAPLRMPPNPTKTSAAPRRKTRTRKE